MQTYLSLWPWWWCLILDTSFGQAKEVCQAASKGNLVDK